MLERIRSALAALPPAEQRVARLLLADARRFATLPVAELAARAGVSKPTVVRFCRSVGYDGLADFKLKLAASVNEAVPFVHRAVREGDQAGDIVVKIVDNAVAAMLRYRNAAASQALARAIAALAEAGRSGRRIEFHGVGNSGIVAQDAQHKFFGLGVSAAALSDGHVQVMGATLLGPGDCAVIISASGCSRDLLDVAQIAHRNGATVIAVCASGSPLARQARRGSQHIVLAADHAEDGERHGPMVSRLLHLLIIDILATGVALQLGSARLRPLQQAIRKNLRERRYVAASPSGDSDSRPSTR